MELLLIVAAVFLAGALVGFGIATIYTSAHTIRLYDEKRELARDLTEARAQKQALEDALKTSQKTAALNINISDDTVGQSVEFGKF